MVSALPKSSNAPWWATWTLIFVAVLIVWTADPVTQAWDAATDDPLPAGTLVIGPGEELSLTGWSPSYGHCRVTPAAATLLGAAKAGCSLTSVFAPPDWTGPPPTVAPAPATDDGGGIPWTAMLIVLCVVGLIVGAIWLLMARARSKETAGGRVAWPRKGKPSATTDIEQLADEVIGG